MVKEKLIIVTIIILLLTIGLSGCTEDTKPNGDTTQTSIIGENLLYDPGFEKITSLISGQWGIAGYTTPNITAIIYNQNLSGFKIENNTLKYDNEIKYNGSRSIYIQGIDVFDIIVISNWNQKINDTDIIPYGKDLILSSWIKTKDAEDVVIMIQCWDSADITQGNLIKSQSSKSYGDINGTIVWEKYSIKLVDVPEDTKSITVRFGLIGAGEVWFDDAELYAIG